MAGSGQTARRLSAAEKRKKVLDARIMGASWDAAAKAGGYRSKGAAYTAAQQAIADVPRESAREYLLIELRRLDRLQFALWRSAMAGNTRATHAVLRVMEQRQKLLGLDTVGQADSGEDVRAALRELFADLPPGEDPAPNDSDQTELTPPEEAG